MKLAQRYDITTNSSDVTQIRFIAPKNYDPADVYYVNGEYKILKLANGNNIINGWTKGAPLVFNLDKDGTSMYIDMTEETNKPVTPVAANSLEVGTTLKLKKGNGSEAEYFIVHQGLPDTTLYDTSCDGTWVLRKNILEYRAWDITDNDYGNSDIHAYLNTDFINTFDTETKNAIKQVKIPYQKGTGSGGSVASGINGLSANVFLLGGYEVGFSISDDSYFPIDGAKLSYFDSGTSSSAMNKRIDGTEGDWWLRSPPTSNTSTAWSVLENGYYYEFSCDSTLGIRPAMVLDSNSTVTENEDGSYSLISGGVQ